jgi:hypothetical protein
LWRFGATDGAGNSALVPKLIQWARSELDRHTAAGNHELEGKYRRLLDYVELEAAAVSD